MISEVGQFIGAILTFFLWKWTKF